MTPAPVPRSVLIAGRGRRVHRAGGAPLGASIGLVVVGVPAAVAAFLRLMPVGTLRLAPGIPAAVAVKGMLTFAFFGADAYVSLTLHDVRGQDTWVAGVALTLTTISWTAAAWVQERAIHRVGPAGWCGSGCCCSPWGSRCSSAPSARCPSPCPSSCGAWPGSAIGLAYSPLSVVVLGLAEPGREGAATSSVQLCDVLGIALGTGAGGAFVALGDARAGHPATGLRLAFAVTLAVALAGALAARRLPAELPT